MITKFNIGEEINLNMRGKIKEISIRDDICYTIIVDDGRGGQHYIYLEESGINAMDQQKDDPGYLLRLLLRSLNMEYVLDQKPEFKVKPDEYTDENKLYFGGTLYDDRGDLYDCLSQLSNLIKLDGR